MIIDHKDEDKTKNTHFKHESFRLNNGQLVCNTNTFRFDGSKMIHVTAYIHTNIDRWLSTIPKMFCLTPKHSRFAIIFDWSVYLPIFVSAFINRQWARWFATLNIVYKHWVCRGKVSCFILLSICTSSIDF